MFRMASATVLATVLLTALLPTALTTGPTQPPVDASTLYVGQAGWGPESADPVRAYDTRSCELIFNVYDRLINLGEDVTNQWGTWDVEEQYWEFSLGLAINVPDRTEITKGFWNKTFVEPTDPVCSWWECGETGKSYHINGWVDNNPDRTLGQGDVVYLMECNATTLEPIAERTWHVLNLDWNLRTPLLLHRFCYDFYIRTNPVIHFTNGDTFDIYDVEYSFKRGLVQDQYGSPMWMFYKPFFDQMNSDFWDTGDSADAIELSYLIRDAAEIVGVDPPVLRINVGVEFPDKSFKEILTQTWSSVVSKEFSLSIGCWNGNLFEDMDDNGYPDWFETGSTLVTWWRHINHSPYDIKYCGTGPYSVIIFVPPGIDPQHLDGWIVLGRNSGYWGGWPAPNRRAYLERIDIEYAESWVERREAFKACKLDVCEVPRVNMLELLDSNDSGRMTSLYPEIETVKNISPSLMVDAIFFCFTVDPTSDAIYTGEFPTGIPPDFFNNPSVRKAFAYAFNHSQYLNEVWLDEAMCRETPDIYGLVPDYYCHSPDPPWTYDKDVIKVKEMLEQAIFTQGGVTKSVWDWGGFRLKMYYNRLYENTTRRIACKLINATFGEINALYGKSFFIDIPETNDLSLRWPTFLSKIETFQMPIFTTGWQTSLADTDDFKRSFMHSYGFFASFQNYTSKNGWARTQGPRTGLTKDVLIDLGIKTQNRTEREDIYKDLDDIYLTDSPSFPIAQPLGRKWLKYWVKGWYYNALYGAGASAFPSACDYYYKLYKEDSCWADVIGPSPFPYFPDGVCDMRDIGYVANHFGAKPPDPSRDPPYDPKWAPGTYGCYGSDLYGDRKVDMRDIGFACAHFDHTTQP